MAVTDTFNDIIRFLKKPEDKTDPVQTTAHKVNRLFSTLLILFVAIMAYMVIRLSIEEVFKFETGDHKLTERFQGMQIWAIYVFGVLLAPLLEELIFRLPLRLQHNPLLLLPLLFSKNKNNPQHPIRRFWHKYYGWIFYLSAVLFGALHLTNYEKASELILLLPLLTLQQFLAGLAFGYLRVRYGFVWGFLAHALFNGVLLGMAYPALKTNAEHIISTNTDHKDYTLSIQVTDSNRNSRMVYYGDSVVYKNAPVPKAVAKVAHAVESDLSFYRSADLKKHVNIRLIKKNSNPLNEDSVILKELQHLFPHKIAE